MLEQNVQSELLELLDRLPLKKQRKVLDFARVPARERGTHPDELLRFGGSINLEYPVAMSGAVQEGC